MGRIYGKFVNYIKLDGDKFKIHPKAVKKYKKESRKAILAKRRNNKSNFRIRVDNFFIRSRKVIDKIVTAIIYD